MKGSFSPPRGHSPQVESHCSRQYFLVEGMVRNPYTCSLYGTSTCNQTLSTHRAQRQVLASTLEFTVRAGSVVNIMEAYPGTLGEQIRCSNLERRSGEDPEGD